MGEGRIAVTKPAVAPEALLAAIQPHDIVSNSCKYLFTDRADGTGQWSRAFRSLAANRAIWGSK
jgi:hypothetical protein